MNPKRYKLISDIVAEILEAPSHKTEALLEQLCHGDASIRDEVLNLLNLDVDDSFLHETPIEVVAKNKKEEQIKGTIGRIKIDGLIAKGGMGHVYQGVDEVLKRKVAIKVMNSQLQMSETRRSEFLSEAQILSSLQHPNICQVYDFFVEEQKDVLVLELIKGKTLRQIIDDKKLNNPLEVAFQISTALTAAHERGIVHRDLKPDNIMITDNGTVKILDFGLARSDIKALEPDANVNPKYTQIAGTPGYMSPEQARGEKSNTATDLWSFGLILSELLTKKPPFPKTSSSAELLENSKLAKVNLPTTLPRAESKLLKHMLAADVKDRPTARSVMETIKKIQSRLKLRVLMSLIAGLVFLIVLVSWKYTIDLKEQKDKANLARIEAEKLASFMLHDLHPQLKSLGKLGLLESAAKETLSYYDHLDVEQSQKTLDKQALALIKISSVFDDQGQTQKALDTLYKAKVILKQLIIKEPNNELVMQMLGQTQMQIGELLTVLGEFDKSLIETYQAIQLSVDLTEDYLFDSGDNNNPSAHDRWWLRLRSMYMAADTYRRKGELDKAMEVLSETIKLAEPAVNKLPSLASNYADIIYMLCNTRYQIKVDQEVLKICIKSAKLSEQLLDSKPEEFRLIFNHAIDIGFLSNIYLELNQTQKALETVDKAIELTQKLNQWDPDNKTVENDLVSNLNIKGQILYEQGDLLASQSLFEKSYQIIMRLAKDNEEMHFAHNKLYSEIYLNKLDEAQITADFLKSKGMKTKDLLELFAELDNRINNNFNEE